MKTNLLSMVGLTLTLGCPSDDGPSGETEDGTGTTGATMSTSGSASQSTSSTTQSTESMSGTTEDDTDPDTGETGTGTGTGPLTDTETDGTGSGTVTGDTETATGDTTGAVDCTQYEDVKTCNADSACEWVGGDGFGQCFDPQEPPCADIPVKFCENVPGCSVADKICAAD